MYNSEFNILIIAGEASGDIHGSGLVNALRDLLPKASFSGLGGKKMRAAKVHTLIDIERMGTIGVMEILGDLFHYWKVYQTLSSKISSGQYDAAIPDCGINGRALSRVVPVDLPPFLVLNSLCWEL